MTKEIPPMEIYSFEKHLLSRSGKSLLLLFLCLSLAGNVFAQPGKTDSTFTLEKLGYDDLVERRPEKAQKIFGATRFAEDPDDLPVRTYIITREDIARNGYASLVDVLKHIPGFRTSQPGEALIGETFLMRGLVGNFYTKILINGVPLDPSAAKGMPLGSQLPIRQAERIEIILGPASMIYGADALAGVINIVLPEVDRPVEVMGSVGLGNSGTTEMHLALGGKMGRDKNILRYMIFGSSKVMNDWNLNYAKDSSLIEIQDTASTFASPFYPGNSTIPEVNNIPHESRLIGVSLGFRGFTLNSSSLYRSDHSALGAHPEDMSYQFFNGHTGETIISNRLRYETDLGKLSLRTNANLVAFFMDPNSEYLGIAHPVSADLNFQYAESVDLTLEQLAFMPITKKLNALAGVTYRRETGIAYQGYLENPFDERNVRFDSMANSLVVLNSYDPYSSINQFGLHNEYKFSELGTYLQANYNSKRLHLSAGGRVDFLPEEKPRFSPKIGANYKLTDKITARGFFAEAYRMPSTYHTFNNYQENKIEIPGAPPRQELFRVPVKLSPEELINIEGGVTFTLSPKMRLEVHYFRHILQNSIFSERQFFSRGGTDIDDEDPDPSDPVLQGLFGFTNRNSTSKLNGFQTFFTYDTKFLKLDLSAQVNIGEEKIDGLDDIDAYRELPTFMGRANAHFRFGKSIRLSVYNQAFSGFYWAVIKLNNEIDPNLSTGFYNLDAVTSVDFTSRFMGYFRMSNVLNTGAQGIYTHDTSGQQFDFVLQQNRMFILGLTYQLQ